MPNSKFIILDDNILLEYSYNHTIKSDNYEVINNLKNNTRTYTSKIGFNNQSNTIFPVDVVIDKYAKSDPTKHNFIKLENYTTAPINFDNVKIHLPTNYNFISDDYIGFYIKLFTYDFDNRNMVELCSLIYDDTDFGMDKNIVLNQEFLHNEKEWGKYLTFDIPSLYEISNQRMNNNPIDNSINKNWAKPNGVSTTSPIFIEFAYVISKEILLGRTSYYLGDRILKSLSKIPEFLDLGVTIQESFDGDYFEIYGTYGGSNELLDNFVDEVTAKGRRIRIEYEIQLYEENILMNTETRIVTNNFTRTQWYRPIISFSNTTASIDVTMNVIDLLDMSKITRTASINLRNNLFKYGRKLTKIDISNAYKPKIYNLKKSNNIESTTFDKGYKIDITKVNYPVIADRVKILVGSSPSPNPDYKPMGVSEIILNPFGNVLKFSVGKNINNSVVPYNLTEILENATITLSFKSDKNFLEKEMWQETDENNLDIGQIIFKISQQDINTIKKIGQDNKNFYLTIKSEKTRVRSLLYSGKWVDYEDVTFIETETSTVGVNLDDFKDLSLSKKELESVARMDRASVSPIIGRAAQNSNLMVFLNTNADVDKFDKYLESINTNIHLRKPAGNNENLVYLYFLLNITPTIQDDIKKQIGVDEVISIPFCIGQYDSESDLINLQNIKDQIINFNCDDSN